ncbi:PorP/SprF family type IX secretion system membrane protein [Cecembia lonarensis]|uniref:Bacteroidetes-specific putative membrane protein n=1 Tax=Cecembia lonarensis (strain CCUG 58316 / KCTC 22772 / LW9) TaxID=1225176 RepID=K1KZQ8_CECL9|nr:type IX secretion system membrane protein PorP/SprF [Cecembia lonarensis]EKB48011.1 Bacteroidetes-specific putative membrane protein [Cecembia lonarensis LW9]
MRVILILITFIFCTAKSFGQDVQFSQFYAAPLYLNPAFAGSAEMTRVGLNFRNQWPGLDQTFVAYSAYLDHFIEGKNSGVGVIINGSYETLSNLANNEVGVMYAYRVRLGGNTYLRLGAQGSFATRSAAFDDVILSTQLDIDRGIVRPGNGIASLEDRTRSFVDLHTGILFYSESVWLGIAGHHINMPDISYLDGGADPLPIRYSAHGGVKLDLPSGFINDFVNNTRQERSVSFAFNYRRQGLFDQLDLGTELFFDPIVLGLWYRGIPTQIGLPNNEALIALVGFSFENGVDVGYSYDFTLSALGLRNSGGAHEISLRYNFVNQLWRPENRSRMPIFQY